MTPRSTPNGSGRRGLRSALLPIGTGVLLFSLGVSLALAETSQKGPLRVAVEGKFAPQRLPRAGLAPVAVTIGGQIASADPAGPPQLRRIAIAINRHGRLDSRGLPLCRIRQITPSTTEDALRTCRSSLVGEGEFSASVKFPEQAPFPSRGKILAFNGRLHGQPAILAQIYGTKPAPTSYVLPFLIRRTGGTFGTVMEASLPQITGEWGYVTGVSMTLSRRFSAGGQRRSFLAAGCPAPAGFKSAFFPLARTSFAFAGGTTLTTTLTRGCRVKQ